MTGTGLLTRRCDPYGAESGGPKRLLGGVHGPEAVGRIMWHCENAADGRWRMICQHGHRGQQMWLCRAHVGEIGRRQSGLCPKCAWPPEALQIYGEIQGLERELAAIAQAGQLQAQAGRVETIRLTIEDGALMMTELWQLGTIHKCGLRLEEVS